jgi:hypothetical protein
MQFCISAEEGKKKYQTLAGNENTSCVFVIFLQHLDQCSLELDYLGLHAHKIVRSKNGKHGSKPHISHGPSYFLMDTYTKCKRKRMPQRLFFVYQIV